MGDFNFDALSSEKNIILRELENWGFRQLVQEPTHIEGGIIDHCYISETIKSESVILSQKSVYYTDHDIIPVKVFI